MNPHPPAAPTTDSRPPAPWGVFATCAWGLAILVLSLFVYLLSMLGMVVALQLGRPEVSSEGLIDNPLYDFVTTSAALMVICLVPWLLVIVRDLPARDYFALRLPPRGPAALYGAVTLLWIAAALVIGPAFGHEPGLFLAERAMGGWGGILAAASLRIFAVPVAIEIFTRGFLMRGFGTGRVGAAFGLVITTLVGTVLHCFFFASGPIYWFMALFENLLLGAARLRSGSLLLPIAMHVVLVAGLFGGALLVAG